MSGIDQPENGTRLRSVLDMLPLRSRFLSNRFYDAPVDPDAVEGGQRAQDIAPIERAYRGEYAIECEDGSFIGAIRVTPANLSTSDSSKWKQNVQDLATVITSAVSFDAQMAETMRAVDYRDRLEDYRERTSDLRQRALELADEESEGEDSDTTLAAETLADIAEERAAAVNIYNETTLVREHYVVVKVDPSEAAKTISDDRGGIESVPYFGDYITQRRLKKQRDSAEHTETMLDLLRQRIDSLANKLGTLDDISTARLSSVAYSQVIADYYQTANVYANADFGALIRESPVPGEYEDPEHDISHEHVRGTGAASRDGWSRPSVSADGGSTTIGGGTPSTNRAKQLIEESPIPILNDKERNERYKSLLTPERIDPTPDPGHITLDPNGETVHSATIWVDEWPDIPEDGMLREIFAYGKAGVDVTISTHLTGLDKSDAKSDLRNTVNSLQAKWKDAEKKDHITADRKKRNYETARDVKDALEDSDHGLFDVGCYITVQANKLSHMNEAVNAIKTRLSEAPAHARGIRADYNHLAGFRSGAPVAEDRLDKRTKMRGDGLAALFPYANNNLAEPGGIEVGTHENRQEPTVLNIFDPKHRSTGYDFGIIGKKGSGKTITMGQIIHRQKLKHPETDVVVIDPLQEYAGLCELFGGERVVIGGDTAINPFHIEPTPPEKLAEVGRDTPYKDAIRRDMDFVESYYDMEGLDDFSDKRGTWERAIKIAHERKGITMDPNTHGNESPTPLDAREVFVDMAQSAGDFVDEDLEDVEKAVEDREDTAISILNNDLEPFSGNGKYEHLTRQTEIDMEESGFLYLDLQQYENEQDSGGLMMELLVSQVYEQAKVHDHPSMLAIDESHYMLRRSSSMESLKQASRHGRHYDLSLGFGTHSLKEFFDESGDGSETQLTDNAEIIINNMAFMFFLFLDEMNEDWAGELGLSKREMGYIQDAKPGNEERGYSQALLKVDEKGCYPLHIEMSDDLNPREFAMLRYDQSNHPNDLGEYLERFDDSCAWSWAEDDYGFRRTGDAHDTAEDTADDGSGPSTTDDSGGAEGANTSRETDADESDRDQPLAAIEGVGEKRSAALHRAGFDTVGDVLDSDADSLTRARGIGKKRAGHLQDAAEAFVENGYSALDPGQPVTEIGTVSAEKVNALHAAGYGTVREVVDADPDDLAAVEGFDATSAEYIQRRAEKTDQTAAADGGRP
jgi:hypothetical protein